MLLNNKKNLLLFFTVLAFIVPPITGINLEEEIAPRELDAFNKSLSTTFTGGVITIFFGTVSRLLGRSAKSIWHLGDFVADNLPSKKPFSKVPRLAGFASGMIRGTSRHESLGLFYWSIASGALATVFGLATAYSIPKTNRNYRRLIEMRRIYRTNPTLRPQTNPLEFDEDALKQYRENHC